jgi:hypothetical protein
VVAARVAQAGFGELDEESLKEAATGLAETIGRGCASGDWQVATDLFASIGRVLNEHHRQLQQVRTAVIVDANEWLEKRFNQGVQFEDLLDAARR